MDDFTATLSIASSGLKAQSQRMKIVTQNIANVQSTGAAPGDKPYTRKLVRFAELIDRQNDARLVKVGRVIDDKAPYILKYQPTHPAANDKGYVEYPNVNTLIELGDMREAQLSYQANLNVITTTRRMVQRTIDLLRNI